MIENPDDDDNNDDKKNDDKNNDDDNDDSNNNNDNDDDTDKTTPSPTVLDIKEPCTICNTDSLGVNTYAILPTNDGMTCADLVQFALKIESKVLNVIQSNYQRVYVV